MVTRPDKKANKSISRMLNSSFIIFNKNGLDVIEKNPMSRCHHKDQSERSACRDTLCVLQTYLCLNLTSRRTWSTPDCCSSSSLCPSAAAPAEPAALSAPTAGGPLAALHAHPAPAASEMRRQGEKQMSSRPNLRHNKDMIITAGKSTITRQHICQMVWAQPGL